MTIIFYTFEMKLNDFGPVIPENLTRLNEQNHLFDFSIIVRKNLIIQIASYEQAFTLIRKSSF